MVSKCCPFTTFLPIPYSPPNIIFWHDLYMNCGCKWGVSQLELDLLFTLRKLRTRLVVSFQDQAKVIFCYCKSKVFVRKINDEINCNFEFFYQRRRKKASIENGSPDHLFLIDAKDYSKQKIIVIVVNYTDFFIKKKFV